MNTYSVNMGCPECGAQHLHSSERRIPGGPDRDGSVADLYGDGPLPQSLAIALRDAVWCDKADDYLYQPDRRQWWVRVRS